ncbi:MAG: histidine phosphatase family protein [Candidatus Dormibacteraeota bacterium]|nr:histidine phosphatase family protein [Candidatus Dormibacteraeota bacterium]
MTRVYLIRHAAVENPNRILYGHLPGFPLSAFGREQAAEVGRRMRDSGIRRIVHSPLERAAETARIMAAEMENVELISDPELREAEFSRYLQGVPYVQIPIRRPLWFVHKMRRGLLPGDESIRDLGGRILGVMHRVAEEHPEEVSALVSHADPLQAAWVLLEDRPQNERELYRKPVDRAGVLEVDLDGERVAEVRYIAPPKREPSAPPGPAEPQPD